VPDDEAVLTERIIAIASQYGRYGYRRVTGMLRNEGFRVNHKRVERIWRREGLKVPKRQPQRGRLWLNDGSCVRLRPQHRNHVWSYDFMMARTSNGRPEPNERRRPGRAAHAVCVAGRTGALALRQRLGVHGA
jgi:transposase InsO family protein